VSSRRSHQACPSLVAVQAATWACDPNGGSSTRFYCADENVQPGGNCPRDMIFCEVKGSNHPVKLQSALERCVLSKNYEVSADQQPNFEPPSHVFEKKNRTFYLKQSMTFS